MDRNLTHIIITCVMLSIMPMMTYAQDIDNDTIQVIYPENSFYPDTLINEKENENINESINNNINENINESSSQPNDQTDPFAIDGDMQSALDSISQILEAEDQGLTYPEMKRHDGRDWGTWRPNPKKATWLAIVLPGAGQIYNRKYWKLPIFYGGFVGCIYALRWNGQMYHDYSQAYMDIVDDDETTQSYNQFLHLGTQITDANKDRYQEIFRKRKDRYRRYRDLSTFALIGVYVLSVIDAYVDASLSEFDISKDLSMKVSPAIISDRKICGSNTAQAIGLGCSLRF